MVPFIGRASLRTWPGQKPKSSYWVPQMAVTVPIVRQIDLMAEELDHYDLDRLRRMTRMLVRRHRRRIERVATALLRRKTSPESRSISSPGAASPTSRTCTLCISKARLGR
jgi:hypothetical protein